MVTSSVLELPSSQRVDAIVHDGTSDLRIWPRPGPDRDLLDHYGSELPAVLERERRRLPGGELDIGAMLRLHRGKLHCDFLLWIASRAPEDRGIRAPAPNTTILERAVKDALAFVAQRHVLRVAIGALGEGPKELDEAERLVVIARAANAYYDECYKAGKPAGVEEVLVCHPHASKISAARRTLGHTVKVVASAAKPAPSPAKPKRKRAAPAGGGRKKTTRKAATPSLSAEEVGRARATAGPYDRALTYEPGQYFVHGKFGVGRVESITPEGFIIVRFESGAEKRLLHNRP